jgi:ribonucleotide monophosphatase NagD (HAD superfamily)
MFETSTGRRPEVIGKPNAVMATSALARLEVAPADAAMVGDRLETDVRMANDAGLASILVLTGATTIEQADAASDRPTHVCADLHDVLSLVRCHAHRKE